MADIINLNKNVSLVTSEEVVQLYNLNQGGYQSQTGNGQGC